MKTLYSLIVLALAFGSTSEAQWINFEAASIPTGNTGTYSQPLPTGAALQNAYSQIADWTTYFQIEGNVTRGITYNKALLFEDSNASITFGPLAEGSFFFTMLTEATGTSLSSYYAECEVRVYNSNHTQLGTTETFTVSNDSPYNGAKFCSATEFVPLHGYVTISAPAVNFQKFYIDEIAGTGSPLPVELTSFRSYLKNDIVELQWNTATEINNFGFDIERSADGENWSTLGFVEGFGTTSSPKQYSFRDARLDRSGGELYYRLKQMDRDGSSDYSDVLRVALSTPTSVHISAYPQPFAGNLNIDLSSQSGEQVRVTLYNSLMQNVATVYDGTVDGSMTMTIPTNGLRDGSYFLVLQRANGEASMQKLLHFQNK